MALLDLQAMETPEPEHGAYKSSASHHGCGGGDASALSLLLCG
ncbi:MAG: SapB/AmfS family lanthipeptide [Micromonosporaceae bacterium]